MASAPSPQPPHHDGGAPLRRRSLGRILRVALTLAAVSILLWLLDRIGWSEVGGALGRLGILGATLLIVLGICENLFDAASFHVALRRKVGALRMLGYAGVGGLINILIPWDAGELVKVGLVRRHVGLSDAIAGTIVWNYLCKLSRPIVGTGAALLGLAFCSDVPLVIRGTIVGASVLSAAPYLIIKWVLSHGATESVVQLLTKVRLLREERAAQWAEQATKLDGQIREFYRQDPSAYWQTLVLQMLAKISSWAALTATMKLLGLGYSLPLAALLYAGISVATYVYMLLPSRLGVGEVAGAGVFALLGLPFNAGLIVQLVMRLKGIVTLSLASILAAQSATAPTQRDQPSAHR